MPLLPALHRISDVQLKRYRALSLELIESDNFDIHEFAENVRAQTGLCRHLINVVHKKLGGEGNSIQEQATQICHNMSEGTYILCSVKL